MPLSVPGRAIPLGAHLEMAADVSPGLRVPQVPQKSEEWCWAACVQMVLNARQVMVSQCDIVNRQFNQQTCCQEPDSEECNLALSIYDVETVYNAWGLAAQFVPQWVDFATLQAETSSGRPVEVGFAWNGAGGYHVAIAWGTAIDTIGPVVLVNDPKYGSGSVYYVNLLRAYGYGSWQWTWISIQ
jgi:hypothetical protein